MLRFLCGLFKDLKYFVPGFMVSFYFCQKSRQVFMLRAGVAFGVHKVYRSFAPARVSIFVQSKRKQNLTGEVLELIVESH